MIGKKINVFLGFIILGLVLFGKFLPNKVLAYNWCVGPCDTVICPADYWPSGTSCAAQACDARPNSSSCKEGHWVDDYTYECDLYFSACELLNITMETCDTNYGGADCCLWFCNPTHLACADESCVAVDGDGADLCSSDADCSIGGGGGDDDPTHLACVGLSCTSIDGAGLDLCDTDLDCLPPGPIEGQVKLDVNDEATLIGGVGGTCQLGVSDGQEPGANSFVRVNGVDYSVASDDGRYSTLGLANGTYSVILDIGDTSTWVCSCPVGCTYTDIAAGATGVDFFVTNSREAWSQIENGSIHASGGISIKIPSSAFDPYLIIGEPGLMSYGIDWYLGGLGSDNISEGLNDWSAKTNFDTVTGYDYFYRILSEDPEGMAIWDGTNVTGTGVYESESSEDMTTSGEGWSIGSTQKTVIIHDGDLTISSDITVDPGGFLAIIVSGDLTIADAVTKVHGVYVADGVFSTCSSASNVQLNAEGTFVGWTGVTLCRDFGTTENNTTPVEIFTYRPDFLSSVYKYLEKPIFSWQEVAP